MPRWQLPKKMDRTCPGRVEHGRAGQNRTEQNRTEQTPISAHYEIQHQLAKIAPGAPPPGQLWQASVKHAPILLSWSVAEIQA